MNKKEAEDKLFSVDIIINFIPNRNAFTKLYYNEFVLSISLTFAFDKMMKQTRFATTCTADDQKFE